MSLIEKAKDYIVDTFHDKQEKKTEKKEKKVEKKDSTTEILQETQKSIDNLSKAIVDQKLDEQKKKSMEVLVLNLSTKLLSFQTLETSQKDELKRIVDLLHTQKEIS